MATLKRQRNAPKSCETVRWAVAATRPTASFNYAHLLTSPGSFHVAGNYGFSTAEAIPISDTLRWVGDRPPILNLSLYSVTT